MMTQSNYINFDYNTLSNLGYYECGVVNLDALAQTLTKKVLLNNSSYATTPAEFDVVKENILNLYEVMLRGLKVKYDEVKRITNGKHTLTTRDVTNNYGDEKSYNTYFEPKLNNVAAEVKKSGSYNTYAPDDTSENSTYEEINSENEIMKKFYDEMNFIVIETFIHFINKYTFL